MSMTRPRYPSEFREQMVELVRSGRSPEELAREFEPLTGLSPSTAAPSEPPCRRQGSRDARPTAP